MTALNQNYIEYCKKAVEKKLLLPESLENIEKFTAEWEYLSEDERKSLDELFACGDCEELNDRFFKQIAFGTGGIRGKVIAKKPTTCEWADSADDSPECKSLSPQNTAVGSNCLNDSIVLKATLGLWKYHQKAFENTCPSLVIAHDVRAFSRKFAELTASLWSKLGGKVYLFDEPTATPLLAYSIKELNCDYGIVITASHNAYRDNGYKVYASDGNQITSKLAKEIFANIKSTSFAEIQKFREIDLKFVEKAPKSVENSYLKSLESSIIDKANLSKNCPTILYTPLHGTGAVLFPKVAKYFKLNATCLDSQMTLDWRFSTVKSPNPEERDGLNLGIEKAKEINADALLATDPDSDRMGVAIKNECGEFEILSGNQVAAMLAEYRIARLDKLGILQNKKNCAVIKSYITTPLVDAICKQWEIKCVNTLTGFKYIGEKLSYYEHLAGSNFEGMSFAQKAIVQQKNSTFFVLGVEESLGYLASDKNREKDAFSAILAFSDMMAYLKSKGKSAKDFLDEIYLKYGYYLDIADSVKFKNASDAKNCESFLQNLNKNPLREIAGLEVDEVLNFSNGGIFDADNQELPKEKFFIFTLKNGTRVGLRASGTEAKVKMYVSICEKVESVKEIADKKHFLKNVADAIFIDLKFLLKNSQGQNY